MIMGAKKPMLTKVKTIAFQPDKNDEWLLSRF